MRRRLLTATLMLAACMSLTAETLAGQQVQAVVVSNDPLSQALESLKLGKYGPTYVSDQGGYYLYPTASDHFGKDLALTVKYQSKEGWGRLSIDGTEVESGTDYQFSKVEGGKTNTLSISHTNGNTVSRKLTFTTLPVVRIYGSFGYDYSMGSIVVQEPDKAEYTMQQMKAKWR